MRLDLGHSMRLVLAQGQNVPSPGILAMNGLSTEEIEELANEMVELAQSGMFSVHRPRADQPGNLMNSRTFAATAENISGRSKDHRPEYAIASDLTLKSDALAVRARIERSLSMLKRPERAKPEQIFSKRFLDEFDWITTHRKKVVGHAVMHQKAFVTEPYNPLLLKPLKQQDLGDVVGCHTTTICRLIKDLMIEFPDTSVREFAVLVPGGALSSLQGRYVVGLLAKDHKYYDAMNGWKISDEDLARILRDEYKLDVQRRVVSKYRQWVDEYLLKPRRRPGSDVAAEIDQDDEQEEPNSSW